METLLLLVLTLKKSMVIVFFDIGSVLTILEGKRQEPSNTVIMSFSVCIITTPIIMLIVAFTTSAVS